MLVPTLLLACALPGELLDVRVEPVAGTGCGESADCVEIARLLSSAREGWASSVGASIRTKSHVETFATSLRVDGKECELIRGKLLSIEATSLACELHRGPDGTAADAAFARWYAAILAAAPAGWKTMRVPFTATLGAPAVSVAGPAGESASLVRFSKGAKQGVVLSVNAPALGVGTPPIPPAPTTAATEPISPPR